MQNTADMKHNCNDFTLYSWHAAENLACLFNAKTFFAREHAADGNHMESFGLG